MICRYTSASIAYLGVSWFRVRGGRRGFLRRPSTVQLTASAV